MIQTYAMPRYLSLMVAMVVLTDVDPSHVFLYQTICR